MKYLRCGTKLTFFHSDKLLGDGKENCLCNTFSFFCLQYFVDLLQCFFLIGISHMFNWKQGENVPQKWSQMESSSLKVPLTLREQYNLNPQTVDSGRWRVSFKTFSDGICYGLWTFWAITSPALHWMANRCHNFCCILYVHVVFFQSVCQALDPPSHCVWLVYSFFHLVHVCFCLTSSFHWFPLLWFILLIFGLYFYWFSLSVCSKLIVLRSIKSG